MEEECGHALKRVLAVTLCVLCLAAASSQAVATPSFSDIDKQALFLSPLEQWSPTYDLQGYVHPLEQAGYQVDVLVNENVTIAFLKTDLANYDLIILRTESFTIEGSSYFCSGEPVTSKTSTSFAQEIQSHEVAVSSCVGFSYLLIKNNYAANSLRPGLVYALGSATMQLGWWFVHNGASVFVGYWPNYSLGWGSMDALSIKFFDFMSQGYSVKEAAMEVYMYLVQGHGSSGDWPAASWVGNGDFGI